MAEVFNNFVGKVSQDFDTIKPLYAVSKKLNIKSGMLVMPAFLLVCVLVFTGIAANFLVTMLGFCYPAYMSFKALETQCTHSEEEGEEEAYDDDRQWLTYWIIFSLFRFIDGTMGILLQFIPMYTPLKLLFLIYLYHPRTLGAQKVYDGILKGFLEHANVHLEEAEKKLGNQARELLRNQLDD